MRWRVKSRGACSAQPISASSGSFPPCSAARSRASTRSPRAISPRRRRRPPRSASPAPTAPMRNCSPIRRSRRSTIRCPTICTSPGPSARCEAGKHVLCEKPIALDADEAQALIAARARTGKLVAEAFMVRHHPQWRRAREIARSGAIGEVARDPDLLRLSPARRRQHPQQAAGRRRALRHRLLRDPDRALRLRRRADPGRRDVSTSIRSSAPTGWRAR